MKVIVVAVRDQKADMFGHPWYAQTVPMALRHFSDACNNPDPTNQWRNHPEDFALFHLGVFDQSIGAFEPIFPPTQLVVASDIVQK